MAREKALSEESAEAQLDRFLMAVIHDLRAPLRHSLLQAQMLQRSTAGNIEAASQAQLVSVLDANRLANHFLGRLGEYCQAGSGLEDAPQVGADVLLQNALRTFGAQPDVEVLVEDVADCSIPAQAQKVFVELVDNARKFRAGPVLVRISGRIADSECIFEIRDNGIGFDASYGETIWEPLQRLHGVGVYPGFGFGLAISRRIISRMNGKTWANSAVDQGSSFFFSVPLV